MSATCLTSGSQPNLNMPVISSATNRGAVGEKAKFVKPTLRRSTSGRLPHSSGNIRERSPSSPRSVNIQDRMIPNRSLTDMPRAQHLFSSSYRAGDHYDSEQQDSSRQVTRILNFGTKDVKAKPFSLVTASLACGSHSSHWAPSANLVVALEAGVYVYQISNYNSTEICNNLQTPENPFCHVIWDSAGESVICGKADGEIEIRDLHTPLRQIKWQMLSNHAIRSIALEQDQLLTCGTTRHGVRIYDLRQTGGSSEPILALKSRTSVNSLSWSTGNGHLLAGGCESGQIYLWDVRSPSNEIEIFKTQDNNPIQVVNWCSWKSSVLFSGSGFPKPSICLHNTAMGVLIGDYECASEVSGIQFNADLKQVATSHHDCPPELAAAAAAAATHIHGAERPFSSGK